MNLYKTYARSVAVAERDPSVVKGENADGKTYTSESSKVTLVAGKDNEYVMAGAVQGPTARRS